MKRNSVTGATQAGPHRLAMLLLAGLLVSTVAAVAVVRSKGVASVAPPPAETAVKVDIHFNDQPDGSVAVLEAQSRRLLYLAQPGVDGFMRSTVRGLVRERKRSELGPEQPFELRSQRDGRLTLLDPSTGRRVDLEAFGPTNVKVFLQVINAHLSKAGLENDYSKPLALHQPNHVSGHSYLATRQGESR